VSNDYKRHLGYLLLVALLVLTAGMGLRDPWPADEPRFALIAKDMVESGNWFLPRAGGVLYPDKPPLFFWLIAAVYAVTGSVRFAFLVPGLLAGLGSLFLVTDLARRLWGERTAIWCGATLLALLQFPLQMKSGQIDGLLCFFTTLALYGLCRHLLLGPDWRWFTAGGLAAGLGVITKGVGFLPLLVIIPYIFAARSDWDVPRYRARDARWLLAPAAFLGALSLWLAPMLLATSASLDPDMLANRNNILFHQTITRYADSWGYIQPPWYLFTNAIPWLWLPASLLLPWLVPKWARDLKARNAAVLVLGGWALLVLLFFSLSMGKGSVYILPAMPAFALVIGLHAEALLRRIGVQRLLVAIPAGIAILLTAAGTYALMNPADVKPWLGDVLVLLKTSVAVIVTGIVMFAVVIICRRRKVLVGYAGAMLAFWLGLSLLLAPAIDSTRSGASLVRRLDMEISPDEELAFVAWPEQLLLQWNRPATHFGFRRDPADDVRDSAAWLAGSANRRALLPESLLEPCYDRRGAVNVGTAHRRQWVLVDRDAVREGCVVDISGPQLLVHYAPTGSRQFAQTAASSVTVAQSASQVAR